MNHPLLHIANVLYIISYSVRDILWLRIITIAAMLCLSYCYIICNEWVPVYWQIAFIGINGVQIGLLLRERRPVELSATERAMKEKSLRPLTDNQIRRLFSAGLLIRPDRGDEIIRETVENHNLVMITAGTADVFEHGIRIAKLEAGQFAGEMSFLTGCNTTASVEACDGTEYVLWTEEALCDLSEKDQKLGTALQSALGGDLVYKLLDMRSRQVSGEGFDARGSITLPRDRIGSSRKDTSHDDILRDSVFV